jgi:hypothetical protein
MYCTWDYVLIHYLSILITVSAEHTVSSFTSDKRVKYISKHFLRIDN